MKLNMAGGLLYLEAKAELMRFYGLGAQFRDGQFEAVEAVMKHKRVLVVRRTGWGKSLVYFLCTRLLRRRGHGLTIVVSPLLTLMQDQLNSAGKFGLKCDALNSLTADRREEILASMRRNELDLVFVTPETLQRPSVRESFSKTDIGLFVVDEAHCISDWGHDFRLEYCRIKDIAANLPKDVPLLATTATANERVIEDIAEQFGGRLKVLRGPLSRDSLCIQVLRTCGTAGRYAWLVENIPRLPGSGLIYCLTQRACEELSEFLNENGIPARPYYSRNREDEKLNIQAEELFRENRIKALVATVKLGMGYDKGDISFVIHYQMPANIVSYYQQIGRAGRSIDRAYVFLMSGTEDEDILEYFIETAFPSERDLRAVYERIACEPGIGRSGLSASLNLRPSRLEKALAFLLNDGHIVPGESGGFTKDKPFSYAGKHYGELRSLRRGEMRQMRGLLDTTQCYSRYIVNALDDYAAGDCGRCSNCLGRDLLPAEASAVGVEKAEAYLSGRTLEIRPRQNWPESGLTKQGPISHVNQTGLCLGKYGDPGVGEMVKLDKYSGDQRFRDALLTRSVKALRPFVREHGIDCVTNVPSLRSGIVEDFAVRLASELGLRHERLLQKSPAMEQKSMQNSAHQCENALGSFKAMQPSAAHERVLLVDDVVDSRWTLTVCGWLLMEQGCAEVYPFALADSGDRRYLR